MIVHVWRLGSHSVGLPTAMSIQPFYSFFKMIRAPPVRFLKWLFEILKSFFQLSTI